MDMKVTYDPAKREAVLRERGLDFDDAPRVFASFHLTRNDEKHSASEERFISVGLLDEDVVIVVWTSRNEERRIVTMWKANEKEGSTYYRQLAVSG